MGLNPVPPQPALRPASAAPAVRRFPVSAFRPRHTGGTYVLPDGRDQHLHLFHFPRFGDLNGDGQLELVYAKGTGEQVAYALDGRELWRYTDATNPSPVRCDSTMPVFDFDRDGRAELACFRWLDGRCHLCVLDAATGELRQRTPVAASPFDPHGSVIPAQLDGPDAPWSLVLHRDYWRLEVFTHDLRPRWQAVIPELGHTTNAADADGDGRDELFTGTRLLAADGREIWARPELLAGTGEEHCDSNHALDLDGDGRIELVMATGAQVLTPDGRVRWARNDIVHHAQSVRPLRRRDGTRALVFTDLPRYDWRDCRLVWRDRKVPDVSSVHTVVSAAGGSLARFEGLHTPQAGDWDGDGEDEVVSLAVDRRHLTVWKQSGTCIARLPIAERVYVSDLVVAPVLPGVNGCQIILHAWNERETDCECVIYSNPTAGPHTPGFTPRDFAAYTAY